MRVTPEFTFFFGQEDFLSNWYPSMFIENRIMFKTNEHYMMYRKAVLFDDFISAQRVLAASNPREAKAIGRQVKNFDPVKWYLHCDQIVFDGAMLKFTSTERLLTQILSTNSTQLVEASPYDKIWGIGLSATDPRALDPTKWLGENKLGIILTSVRNKLKEEPRSVKP